MNQLFKNRYKEREPGALLKAMTPQPSIEAKPDTETHAIQSEHIPEASQKTNIFGKLWDGMKTTFSETAIPATETSPATTKEGLGHKIMKYALPALTTMAGGAGALPGLMGAFAGEAKNRRTQVEDLNTFQKTKAANELKAADDIRALEQFRETKRHNLAGESLAASRLKKQETITPEDLDAYQKASPALRETLKSATTAELADAEADTDPIVSRAARYMRLKRASVMPKENAQNID